MSVRLRFGALADRYGRKKPLIACVIYFSAATTLSAFAPNYILFFALRALYGIGMGGYWGIGASFAMENAPRERRGILSGMMQGGYPFGYLLAAVGMQPSHLIGMTLAEGVSAGVIGLVLAFFGSIIIETGFYLVLPIVIGFKDPLRYDFVSFAVWGAVALVVVAVASILPAIRNARVPVLESLQYE